MRMFKGFYKLSIKDKLQKLKQHHWIDSAPIQVSEEITENMIENVIGQYRLPIGVAVNFQINAQEFVIPMAIEEASVVAAASHAAKILGNIESHNQQKIITGQIILAQINITDTVGIVKTIENEKIQLLNLASSLSKNMVQRGGGPKDLYLRVFESENTAFVTVYLNFDPCDAMGANSINTVLEGLSHRIYTLVDRKPLMSILSNYSEESLTTARVSIPISSLHDNAETALTIGRDIELASQYAQIDSYRAVTHNKGIMNGIDAVLVATANDWRAVNASVHAFASRSGNYRGLSQWSLEEECLKGELTLPLPVATVGGSITAHSTAKWSLGLLKNPDAKQLSEIICAVGLAQNFAALKALVSEGIQKGHMAMQARNIAIAVGANGQYIDKLVEIMIDHQTITREFAIEKLEEIMN